MSQNNASQHLESLIRSIFEDGRCGEYYLVDLEISAAGLIRVYIDGDEGVSLDACKQVSRILEAVLDAEPTLGGIYELEVSSPGISRPLKFSRQYLKHVSRTLRLELTGGEIAEGVLKSATPDVISMEIASTEKKGKPTLRDIPFKDILEAYVTIQFGQKKNRL